MRVAVVGGGIIGTAIAMELASAGATVALFDAGQIGECAGSGSFGWVNSTYGFGPPYLNLRMASMRRWHDLKARYPGLPASFAGGIFHELEGANLERFVSEHAAAGYAIRLLSRAEIAQHEPGLTAPPAQAAFAADEGAAEPVEAARFFAGFARDHGAETRENCSVSSLLTEAGRVVGCRFADGSEYRADITVLAAGTSVPSLANPVGLVVPVAPVPGLLIETQPVAPILRCVVNGPGLHMRQRQNGALLAGFTNEGALGNRLPHERASTILHDLQSALNVDTTLRCEHLRIAERPKPHDGLPIVGETAACPGLYVAVMHSGVTLAPGIAGLVAREILKGERVTELSPYRPERSLAVSAAS